MTYKQFMWCMAAVVGGYAFLFAAVVFGQALPPPPAEWFVWASIEGPMICHATSELTASCVSLGDLPKLPVVDTVTPPPTIEMEPIPDDAVVG